MKDPRWKSRAFPLGLKGSMEKKMDGRAGEQFAEVVEGATEAGIQRGYRRKVEKSNGSQV